MTFEDLGLSPEVLRAVTDAGYQTPTPIQAQAVPYVLMGRDVLGCAQTGTGKTASFTLPMIDILDSGRARARMPRSLIIEPTRELAAQVAESFERYGKYHPLSMALLIGGQSLTEQEKRLDRGVDVLIATPGRLLDLFERGRVLLADVKILVIDESDRMLDMGFMPDVERIVGLLPRTRQTLFFSATMPPEIRRLAGRFLMNPKELSVTPPATAAETVRQAMVEVPALPRDKRRALRDLLQQEAPTSALIFCNRKRDVGILYRSLARHGFAASELHGDLPQPVRTETLERFRRGDMQLLVCSDVAARGLDIPKVSHVINFDVPHNAEDYIHRIGRTGRAGRSGKALMLVTRDDRKTLAAITQMLGHTIERTRLPGNSAQAEAAVTKVEDRPQSKTEPRAPDPRKQPQPEADNGGRVSKSSGHAAKQRHDSLPSAAPAGPFGEHVPAFLLRPVRHVADA
jgi:superfamily II DNA/RNA helicase